MAVPTCTFYKLLFQQQAKAKRLFKLFRFLAFQRLNSLERAILHFTKNVSDSKILDTRR